MHRGISSYDMLVNPFYKDITLMLSNFRSQTILDLEEVMKIEEKKE